MGTPAVAGSGISACTGLEGAGVPPPRGKQDHGFGASGVRFRCCAASGRDIRTSLGICRSPIPISPTPLPDQPWATQPGGVTALLAATRTGPLPPSLRRGVAEAYEAVVGHP